MISIHGTPSPFCPVGRNIGTVLSQTYDTLKKDVISSMESVTMEKIIEDYRALLIRQ
jgi:hypothetical protein